MTLTAMPGCRITEASVAWETRSCADHGDAGCDECPDPKELMLDPATSDEHLNALVVYVVDQVHEAIEWIKFDGQRFATPHPGDDMEHWDFLSARITRLLRDYRRRWPVQISGVPVERVEARPSKCVPGPASVGRGIPHTTTSAPNEDGAA